MVDANETELLIDFFHRTCCSEWDREDIATCRELRFAQTYLMMARAEYRPAAPSDGMGNIQLTKGECNDRERLYREAIQYAVQFAKEDDGLAFHVGCSNWETNRATVLSIEAARLLAGGGDGNNHAIKLLRLAIKEISEASNRRKKRQNKPRLSPLSPVI